MAFKLIESAQHRWRAVNYPQLVALVRAGARFENGRLVERPDDQGAISESHDTPFPDNSSFVPPRSTSQTEDHFSLAAPVKMSRASVDSGGGSAVGWR